MSGGRGGCSRGRGARADGARRGEDLVVVPADKGLVACGDAEDGSATVPRRFRDGSRKCLDAEEVDLVKVGVRKVLQAEGLVPPAGRGQSRSSVSPPSSPLLAPPRLASTSPLRSSPLLSPPLLPAPLSPHPSGKTSNEIWPPIEKVSFRSANSSFILATIVSRTWHRRGFFYLWAEGSTRNRDADAARTAASSPPSSRRLLFVCPCLPQSLSRSARASCRRGRDYISASIAASSRLARGQISAASRRDLGCISERSRTPLGDISAASRRHLGHISARSRPQAAPCWPGRTFQTRFAPRASSCGRWATR